MNTALKYIVKRDGFINIHFVVRLKTKERTGFVIKIFFLQNVIIMDETGFF